MKIKIRSTHRPCLVTTPNKTKTLIVGGTITEVNGEEWNHPYCAIVPGDAITLDDIEWESFSAVEKPLEYEDFKVPSDTRHGVYYTVRRFSDGNMTCTCLSYQFGKGKACKHIKEIF